jgi:hypothetical protein
MDKKVEEELKKALDSVVAKAAPKDEAGIAQYLASMSIIARSIASANRSELRSWFHERVMLWCQVQAPPKPWGTSSAKKHLDEATKLAGSSLDDTEVVSALTDELVQLGHV